MLLLATACSQPEAPKLSLVLGATTTIEDSGLLNELDTQFHKDHPRISVRTITGATGEVHRLARRGDVDLTITHDPAAESTLVANGVGLYRRDLMYNEFVIVGPPTDTARIRGLTDAPEAFRRIAQAQARFISRGDDSGTQHKELSLWQAAGLNVPSSKPPWYTEAGVGMGEALRIASERKAYTLTDRGTYLALQPQLQLAVLVQGDPRLLNRYGIVRMRNARNGEAADSYATWLTSARGHAVIANYGLLKHGQSLFTPVE